MAKKLPRQPITNWIYERLARARAELADAETAAAVAEASAIATLPDRHKDHSHRWVKRGGETTGADGRAVQFITYVCVDCQLGELREA